MKKITLMQVLQHLPNDVFKNSSEAIKELDGTGLSILEISHRSKKFSEIISRAKDLALEISGLETMNMKCYFYKEVQATNI